MAPLSNAERQARYKQRLKDAAKGVTPDMIDQARRVLYREVCRQNDEPEDWDGFVARCRKKGGRHSWLDMLPDGIEPDAYEWVEGADDRVLLERVGAVMHAARYPAKD